MQEDLKLDGYSDAISFKELLGQLFGVNFTKSNAKEIDIFLKGFAHEREKDKLV